MERRVTSWVFAAIAHIAAIAGGCAAVGSDADGADAGATAQTCPTHLRFESLGDITRIDVGYTG